MPATLEKLLPRVIEETPRCPESVQRRALTDAWRAFCVEADAWRVPLEPIPLVDGVQSYSLNLKYDADVSKLDEIWWKTAADIAANRRGQMLNPAHYPVSHDGNQWVLEFRDGGYRHVAGGYLVPVAVLVPQLGTDTDVPENILQLYGDALASKAIASLKGQRGKPYYDPDGWMLNIQTFNQAKSRVRREASIKKTGSGSVFQ